MKPLKRSNPFSKCFRTDVSLSNETFPLDINLFNEESKLVISMLSQFLGLDTNIFVPELLMSLLFKINISQLESQSPLPTCLKFDEFVAEKYSFSASEFPQYQALQISIILDLNVLIFQ